MRCMQCVSEQDDVAMAPVSILNIQEIDPLGIIREQRMAVQISGEDLFKKAACLDISHAREPRVGPRSFVAFDDERAGCLIELVRVCREDTLTMLSKGEGQTVKQLMGAVPDVLVGTDVQRRLKMVFVFLPDGAVHAICA